MYSSITVDLSKQPVLYCISKAVYKSIGIHFSSREGISCLINSLKLGFVFCWPEKNLQLTGSSLAIANEISCQVPGSKIIFQPQEEAVGSGDVD
jgi:hypothetical protein